MGGFSEASGSEHSESQAGRPRPPSQVVSRGGRPKNVKFPVDGVHPTTRPMTPLEACSGASRETSLGGGWCGGPPPPTMSNSSRRGSTSIQKSAGRGRVVHPWWFSLPGGGGARNIPGFIPRGLNPKLGRKRADGPCRVVCRARRGWEHSGDNPERPRPTLPLASGVGVGRKHLGKPLGGSGCPPPTQQCPIPGEWGGYSVEGLRNISGNIPGGLGHNPGWFLG